MAASSGMASNLPVAKKIDVMLQFDLVAKLANVATCNARVLVATIQTGIVWVFGLFFFLIFFKICSHIATYLICKILKGGAQPFPSYINFCWN